MILNTLWFSDGVLIFFSGKPPRNILQIMATSVAFTLNFAELGCYIAFFRHAYKHDQRALSVTTAANIHQRHKKNAISFIGQFYGFCTEFVFLGIFIFVLWQGKSHIEMKALAMLINYSTFAVVSIVEVITSQDMRNYLIRRWRRITGLFSYFIFWF